MVTGARVTIVGYRTAAQAFLADALHFNLHKKVLIVRLTSTYEDKYSICM
jgi:hypothetical protein